MRNLEGRLAKLEDVLSNRHGVALDWLLCLARTIQGDDQEARERLQHYSDAPISRGNNERMHSFARRVLAGECEADSAHQDSAGVLATANPCERDLSE
jgi:hypothetical protein